MNDKITIDMFQVGEIYECFPQRDEFGNPNNNNKSIIFECTSIHEGSLYFNIHGIVLMSSRKDFPPGKTLSIGPSFWTKDRVRKL